MSNHRTRYRRKIEAARQGIAEELSRQISDGGRAPKVFDLSGFDGANFSTSRAYVPWPTMDTKKELTGGYRREMMKRVRWLYANNGHARRAINGLANLIGFLTPQATTTDKAWNRAAERHFNDVTKSAGVFDRSGKFNWKSWQIATSRCELKDGDVLTYLGETKSGIAQILLYESHQMDSHEVEDKSYQDGVQADKHGKHLRYQLISGDTKYSIDATDCIFHADFERPGQVRGYPALAAAVNHLLDITETDSDTKQAIKRAAYVGLYRKRNEPGVSGPQGLLGPTIATSTGQTVTDADSVQKTLIANIEYATGYGGIPRLDTGESLEVVADARPGPNQREYTRMLLEQVAHALCVSPNILFSLSGQNGPEVRFDMAELRRWVQMRLINKEIGCRKFWTFFWAKEFAGGYPMPNDDEWWKCSFIPNDDPTIDRGREGKLALEELKVGATTLADIWGGKGADWEDKAELHIETLATMKAMAEAKGLTLAEVMPGFDIPKIGNEQNMVQSPGQV